MSVSFRLGMAQASGPLLPHALKPSQPREAETRALAPEELCLKLFPSPDWLPLPDLPPAQGSVCPPPCLLAQPQSHQPLP